MRKIISFMHISLDGFVAGPNGEMNWIKVDEELFDYVGKRISTLDTALYGRKTYDMMESYWPTAGDAPNASTHDIEHSKWYKNARKKYRPAQKHMGYLWVFLQNFPTKPPKLALNAVLHCFIPT